MGRIRSAYETKFRTLLSQFSARKVDYGIQNLLQKAELISRQNQLSLPLALANVHEQILKKAFQWRKRSTSSSQRPLEEHIVPGFICDVGLGGLARWIRAAGYEAEWKEQIDDGSLVEEAINSGAILLTTDSLLMDRRAIRTGQIQALWVSPALRMREQLAFVLRELHLSLRTPRCMACGGTLVPISKEAVRDRIPPKTYLWRDEYFVCSQCDKLFWYGSHWERIGKLLSGADLGRTAPPIKSSGHRESRTDSHRS